MNLSHWLPWIGRKGNLFGHHLHFALPRYELTLRSNVSEFCPTVSTRCGEETFAFYDSAYDARSGTLSHQFRDDPNWAALEAECDANGIPGELSLARRRYIGCVATSELSLFLDIWVHRNSHCGDLRDPANLRRAAELFIAQNSLAKNNAEEQDALDDGGLFGHGLDESGEVHGVNWRQRDLGGRRWQLYEEYHHHRYFGESWLLPLGEHHFLRVHLYRMGSWSPSRQGLQELRSFIEGCMRRFRVHSPDTERERPGNIDIEPTCAAPGALDKRRALEDETAQMPYLLELAKPRVREPLFDSLWWWLVGVACLARGGVAAGQYLEWEQTLTIFAIYGIAERIHQKLKSHVAASEPRG